MLNDEVMDTVSATNYVVLYPVTSSRVWRSPVPLPD
jgi:hypothetical protein